MVVRVTRGGAAARHGAHSTSTSANPAASAATTAHGSARAHAERDAAPGCAAAPSVADGAASASSISSRASRRCPQPPLAILLQTAAEQRRIAVGVSAGQRAPVRLRLQHRREHVARSSRPSNSAPAGQHLEEHDAERPDVRALVDRLARAPARGSCTPPCRGSSRACRHRRRRDRRRLRHVRCPPRPAALRLRTSPGRSRAPSPCRRAAP